nr:peptidoglycan DD-metalloendopeptidase family protein [Microbulbifer sp. YPW1]
MKRRIYRHKNTAFSGIPKSVLRQLGTRVFKILIICLLSAFATACASNLAPTSSLSQPPSQKLQHHLVSKGETLYSIAWRYGKDFKDLAAINGITSPYRIFPGQRLKLAGRAPVQVARKSAPPRRQPRAVTPPSRVAVAKSSPKKVQKTSIPDRHSFDTNWRWPVKGRVISSFQANNPLRKGVDIAGKKGESVQAAADGTVIYAGSALRGYGKLLILKHSEEFLSAYAHNDKLLVGEGAKVKAGQRIAELGSSGTDRDMLHFEIRKNGQPVDPMAYLP